MKKNKQAVGCFIEFDNKFLLLHRVPGGYQGDKWGLVGGEVDANESLAEAVLREIKEEIGFEATNENLKFLGKYKLQYSDQDWDFSAYRISLIKPIDINLDQAEHQDYQWITLEECLLRNDLMDGMYILLKEIKF